MHPLRRRWVAFVMYAVCWGWLALVEGPCRLVHSNAQVDNSTTDNA